MASLTPLSILQGRVFMGTQRRSVSLQSTSCSKRSRPKSSSSTSMPRPLPKRVAFGWYLDGRVTAIVGTHTHIPTADEIVLPKGTAYITDVGMTGPYDSVIGVRKNL